MTRRRAGGGGRADRRRGRGRREQDPASRAEAVVGYARLLAVLQRQPGPVTIPDLVRLLGLESDAAPSLRAQMERLASEGVVFGQRRGRWSLHSRARVAIGRLICPRPHYGFVVPQDGSGPDLYVASSRLHGARHGDTVLVRLVGPEGGSRARRGGGAGAAQGRPAQSAAEVMAVLDRRPPFVTGVFRGDAAGGVVLPRDERESGEILIDRPGDSAIDGAVVWTRITSAEDRFRPARGRLEEVWGPPDLPGVDLRAITRLHDLPVDFPAGASSEAEAWGACIAPSDRAVREDFTQSMVVTVDPETAMDHDDAVGLERVETPQGPRLRLAVHIADVAHYVSEGSALDAEARRRGVSVYFPGRSIPMLPPALSSRICSLVAGEERLVQSVLIDCDDQGRRIAFRFADGVVRCAARLTYEQVAGSLAGGPGPGEPLERMLRSMADLAGRLRARRVRRGSLDLQLPEIEIQVDVEGRPTRVRPAPHTVAHEMIEEFMLAANETVAGYLNERRWPTLYRVHEDPDAESIDAVEERLAVLGVPVRRIHGPARARIKSLLGSCRGRPEEAAVSMMILRSLKLARYSEDAAGHFGLAAPLYTHFTSPIRRYPDLVVHRRLREARRAAPMPRAGRNDEGGGLASVALECSRLERRAEEAERDMVDWKTAVYMKGRIGEEFQGTVSGVTPNAVFVRLDGLGVEGLVTRADGPRWRLGEALRVRVAAVDVLRARVILKPLATG